VEIPMIIEPCCPGRTVTKKILIGGREVGITGLDEILWKGLELGDVPEDVRRDFLFRELRARNYIPRNAEKEYYDAIWVAFLEARDRLVSNGPSGCSCCDCSDDQRGGCG
jgi:hypothetical protein